MEQEWKKKITSQKETNSAYVHQESKTIEHCWVCHRICAGFDLGFQMWRSGDRTFSHTSYMSLSTHSSRCFSLHLSLNQFLCYLCTEIDVLFPGSVHLLSSWSLLSLLCSSPTRKSLSFPVMCCRLWWNALICLALCPCYYSPSLLSPNSYFSPPCWGC